MPLFSMLSEEQKRKNEKHDSLDRRLAMLAAVGGLIWMSVTGVNHLLDQKKAPAPYQDNLRMIEQPCTYCGANETGGYFLLLL